MLEEYCLRDFSFSFGYESLNPSELMRRGSKMQSAPIDMAGRNLKDKCLHLGMKMAPAVICAPDHVGDRQGLKLRKQSISLFLSLISLNILNIVTKQEKLTHSCFAM
jgi:hypothetical protein